MLGAKRRDICSVDPTMAPQESNTSKTVTSSVRTFQNITKPQWRFMSVRFMLPTPAPTPTPPHHPTPTPTPLPSVSWRLSEQAYFHMTPSCIHNDNAEKYARGRFLSMAEQGQKMKSSSAANVKNFIKITTFPFQWEVAIGVCFLSTVYVITTVNIARSMSSWRSNIYWRHAWIPRSIKHPNGLVICLTHSS